jgi:hypothetical protein
MENGSKSRKKPVLFIILLVIIAAAAGAYLAWVTDYAPWGFSDSAAYFSAARNLAAGHSLSVSTVNNGYSPLNLHAPLYPLVLTPLAWVNANLIHVSKIMDILFWVMLVFLNGGLFYQITRSQWGAICFALLCAFSYVLVTTFSSLMSEPLALVLGIPGYLLLVLSIKDHSFKLMLLSAVAIGLSVLTRFAFAALLAAGVLALLIFSDQPWKRRWINPLVFALIGATPMGVWSILQKIQQVSTGGRSLVTVDVFSKLRKFAALVWNTVKYWVPYRSNMIPGLSANYFGPILAVSLLLLVAVAFYLAIRKYRLSISREPVFILAVSAVLFLFAYFGVLLVSFTFTTAPNDINDRMLSPIVPVVFVLLLCSAIMIGMVVKPRVWSHLIVIVLTLFFVVFNFELLRTFGIKSSTYPDGYASPYWNGNAIFEVIQKLPPGTPIASNAPDITLFYANRMPFCLTENSTKKVNCLSAENRTQLQDFVERQCGVLLLFPSMPTDNYENYADSISQSSMDSLKKLYPAVSRSSPGSILYWPECTAVSQALAGG